MEGDAECGHLSGKMDGGIGFVNLFSGSESCPGIDELPPGEDT
jgi:hypothetical protein